MLHYDWPVNTFCSFIISDYARQHVLTSLFSPDLWLLLLSSNQPRKLSVELWVLLRMNNLTYSSKVVIIFYRKHWLWQNSYVSATKVWLEGDAWVKVVESPKSKDIFLCGAWMSEANFTPVWVVSEIWWLKNDCGLIVVSGLHNKLKNIY